MVVVSVRIAILPSGRVTTVLRTWTPCENPLPEAKLPLWNPPNLLPPLRCILRSISSNCRWCSLSHCSLEKPPLPGLAPKPDAVRIGCALERRLRFHSVLRVAVRVVLERRAAECGLDLLLARTALDAEHVVRISRARGDEPASPAAQASIVQPHAGGESGEGEEGEEWRGRMIVEGGEPTRPVDRCARGESDRGGVG
eukprot:scaffold187459_cov28-Tisochrysis_lutea.AAC.3